MSIRESFFNSKAVGSLWDVAVSLKRGNPLPIDADSVFESEAKLVEYIGDKVTTVAYPGQVVAIVNDSSTQVLYLDQELNYHILGDASAIDELTSNLDALIGDVGELEESLNGLLEDVGVPSENDTEATGLHKDIENITDEVASISTEVDNIKKDYLTSEDKADLQGDIDDLGATLGNQINVAKQEAIDAAVKAVLFDGDENDAIANAYDTIKEIAEWIAADETGAAATLVAITNKLGDIEEDYLTSADKTALQGSIDDLAGLVGSLPETATSDTVVEYVQELIDNLKIGDYAKVSELTDLATALDNYKTSNDGELTSIEGRLDELETWQDDQLSITSVDSTALSLSDAGELSIRSGYALLSPEDQEKLSKLILNDDGSVATGEKVAASDVVGLADWLKTWIPSQTNSVKGLVSDEILVQIEEAVRGISINGTVVEMDENNVVDLPIATANGLGLVKSSTVENKVSVNASGEMEVNSLNVNKLVQNEDEYLVLDGGSATGLIKE